MSSLRVQRNGDCCNGDEQKRQKVQNPPPPHPRCFLPAPSKMVLIQPHLLLFRIIVLPWSDTMERRQPEPKRHPSKSRYWPSPPPRQNHYNRKHKKHLHCRRNRSGTRGTFSSHPNRNNSNNNQRETTSQPHHQIQKLSQPIYRNELQFGLHRTAKSGRTATFPSLRRHLSDSITITTITIWTSSSSSPRQTISRTSPRLLRHVPCGIPPPPRPHPLLFAETVCAWTCRISFMMLPPAPPSNPSCHHHQ